MVSEDRDSPQIVRTRPRRVRPFLAVLAVVAALAAGYIFPDAIALRWSEFWSQRPHRPKPAAVASPAHDTLYLHPAPPIMTPPAVPGAKAKVNDAEYVLGVSVGTRHRAYRLAGLSGHLDHVVNDVISGTPVTVTYCDLADCARAFTSSDASRPLPITQVGFRQSSVATRKPRFIIAAYGIPYYQDSGIAVDPTTTTEPLPFARCPVERLTWKEWKNAHPDTDIYYGPVN